MLKSAVPFKNQKFSSIRKDCLKRGVLFEDPEFLANNKSLFYSKVDKDILWKRPKELCKAPKLVVEGVSCDDLNQGELGNAWFVTACASIAQENRLWQKVVPNYKEQEWDDKNEYAGMFHFQFWRFGEWIDVVIDDRLPTKDGKLILCHSHSRNEFWSALLEKAYAKLYGDYESLKTGRVSDALVDLTGGVAESLCFSDMSLEAEEERQPLFDKLTAAKEGNSMITCHIDCPVNVIGEETHNGLLQGQGYVMTDIRRISVPKSLQGAVGTATLQMVRLHNPWGQQKEWTGAWSPSSPEWSSISPSERDKIGLKFYQEGEFWMTYNDYIANFSNTDICHFVNTSFFTIKKSWSEAVMHGAWQDGGRNGGCEANEATFLSNPQYVFDVGMVTDTLMISLEQHDIRSDRQMDIELLQIGFTIMKIEDNRRYRVHIIGEKLITTEYKNSRSIFQYITLGRGRYVLIPTTQEPGQNGKFLLRLYSSGQSAAKELTEECPQSTCCTKPYTFVSKINVVKAEGLQLTSTQTKKGTLDPFVIVRCEGEAVKSQPVDNNADPIWQLQAIFYRKNPDSPIMVEVWNHNAILDDYLAEARITEIDSDNECVISKSYKIYGRKKEQDVEKPGLLYIEMKSNDDLTYL